MSFNLRSIREISTDPTGKFISHLAYRISKLANEQQTQDLENKEDIYSSGQDVDAVLKLHSLDSNKQFKFNLPYFPPTEPDLDKCKIWVQGHNMGNTTRDISGYNKIPEIIGDPILIDGDPFDYGIHTGGTKSLALRFNRPTSTQENAEYIRVPNFQTIDGIGTGISFFMRFKVHSLAQQGNSSRRLFEKHDDTDPATGDAIMAILNTNGSISVQFNRSSTAFEKVTPADTIELDTVYDLWITYTQSGGVLKIYVNGVDQTLSNGGAGFGWHSDASDLDLSIMGAGGTSVNTRFVYGDLYDFMVLREKVVSFNAIGSSVSVDGSNDYISCGTEALLWSQALNQFSFSFWIYPTNIDATDRWVAGNGRFEVYTYESGGDRIRFLCKNAVDTQIAASTPITPNQWNHVVGVYDNTLPSANVKIYVNGVVGGTTGNLTETITAGTGLRLANDSNDFAGNIKDFRWWSTKPLTQTHVTDLYNKSLSAPIPDYWLPLTEGTGTPLDAISGTKTATLTNGAAWVVSEVGNHYTNKWTTAGIPFGQVMIADYYATYNDQGEGGYDEIGFDSTGFDT